MGLPTGSCLTPNRYLCNWCFCQAFREIDARLGGVRRYHEQLSEEHAWYSSAEDRYTALKRGVPDLDSNQVTALADEVSEHFAALVELKDNIVKLKLEKVSVIF